MARHRALHADRHPKIAVLENGKWKQPAGDIMAAVPRRYNRYIQFPKVASDASGRIWVSLQIRTACGMNRADFWAANGRWEHFLTSYEGDHWAPLTPVPESTSRNEGPFQIDPAEGRVDGLDERQPAEVAGGGGGGGARKGAKGKGKGQAKGGGGQQAAPARKLPINEVDGASFEYSAADTPAGLDRFRGIVRNAAALPDTEQADVARMRTYRTTVDGTTYQILRGDFHRHTEISSDGAGDGSVEDYFRYVLDAARDGYRHHHRPQRRRRQRVHLVADGEGPRHLPHPGPLHAAVRLRAQRAIIPTVTATWYSRSAASARCRSRARRRWER